MMNKKDIVKRFQSKALKLSEINLHKRSVYISFPQYVDLVKDFISHFTAVKNIDAPVIFTGLCITPLQWFNYNLQIKAGTNIKISEIDSLDYVEALMADENWLKYHEFLIKLRCSKGTACSEPIKQCVEHTLNSTHCVNFNAIKLKFYRYLLVVDDDVIMNEQFNFPMKTIVEKQLNEMKIEFPTSNDIVFDGSMLRSKGLQYYNNIAIKQKAYFISPSTGLNAKPLGELFTNCFQEPFHTNITYESSKFNIIKSIDKSCYKNNFCVKNLPEDFIIFGEEKNAKISPFFALGCDVSEDKVKLFLLADEDPQLSTLTNFVNSYYLQSSK